MTKRGRPRAKLDEDALEDLAKIGCTDEEIGLILHCSADTLTRNFADRLKKGRAEMRMSLRRTQIKLAQEGNAALAIWLGKQYLGQKEPKLEIDVKQLDADIERELALITAGSETTAAGEVESETIN